MGTITDYRQQWRRDTAANLASDNPTPEDGEPIFETDTGLFKIGRASTAYNGLTYVGQALASGFIFGLETSTAADADHDVTIATGKCRDYADTADMILTAAITKQIDATWSAGDNAGGLFSGTVAADTTYHLFAIRKDSDGSVDAGFDTDISAANIPSGYTAYRRIRSYLTDASSNIINTLQRGNEFYLSLPIEDLDQVVTTTATSFTASIPQGIVLLAQLSVQVDPSLSRKVYVWSPNATEPASVPSNYNDGVITASGAEGAITHTWVLTDSSAGLNVKANTNITTAIYTMGWTDDRGQYGGL